MNPLTHVDLLTEGTILGKSALRDRVCAENNRTQSRKIEATRSSSVESVTCALN